MKTPSKDEIKQAAVNQGAFFGIEGDWFEKGAEWMQEQMQTPQSVEVMTLEECLNSYAKRMGFTSWNRFSAYCRLNSDQTKEIVNLYASQFKAKADHLQAELVECKENYFIATRKYESLENKNLNLKAELEQVKAERDVMREAFNEIIKYGPNTHESIQMKRIAEKVLQSTKQ